VQRFPLPSGREVRVRGVTAALGAEAVQVAAAALDDDGDDQNQRDCIAVIEAALELARSSPMAEPAATLDNVFWGEDRDG